ncbi:MAG: hypothetical protein A2745_01610 [Candidatus Harrisonbacteria bacterium RIFCSPHIGHO2_01_FULL_44_13]|uniref:Type II secretion system protein GspF domain-containing protein n=1 Tax=Candidatus Harrisonbacteria bacterium RIFCSPLOWO2_01_FULL_44_18 TaxID=1798407 RepID=A0A1G1ZKL7_9BACT|nr:MAG: hypothetical protein A2745_01610 [Candidatus Harrisonbacteria bacterium RIFCSPHIGHO2_01_FULL_44_13]OGY65173.1 MAG: hypothetical protein A3A16_00570 [Candidatus Harrisonbacteria bacterium RIFCSPLOWO2_01_FULL_44_18]
MKYRYSARTKVGDLQVGFVEAVNRDAAANILISHDLFVLSLESAEASRWFGWILGFFRRVKKIDLMIFTRQFATMLEAKIPLGDSLKSLYAQTKNVALKETIFEISSDIDAGLSLSQSLSRHANIFSEFYINLVQASEVTGRIEEAVGFLADYLDKEISLLGRVRSALIYPVFVIGLFIVVVGVMVGTVFPQLLPIFEESAAELPLITSLLLNSGNFIADWWLAILVILAILITVLVDYFRTEEGRIIQDQLLINTPVVGGLFRKMYVARFAEAVSVLIKGGIPIAQAMEISSHTVGSFVYREALHEVAEAIRGGELLSQALSRDTNYFPPIVSQMVAVGERTGKLDEMFGRVAKFYTREVDATVGNLVELVQPTLMVVIGLGVGLLFAAVLLPIYNLAATF